jgi:hypothetical protein
LLQHRYLRLAGATGALRTAQFHGREHLVVPVIPLVEGVITPFNSKEPELVLASEFLQILGGWNGRPVVLDHPDVLGQKVSANSPEILESCAFGQLFNAEGRGDRFAAEAWLDPQRLEALAEAGADMMTRVREGKSIEVSVGTFMELERTAGEYKGKHYVGIWRNIVPDHLAFLTGKQRGACNNDMGCGVRTATAYLVTAAGLEAVEDPMNKCTKHNIELRDGKCEQCETEVPQRSLRERLISLMSFRSNKGTAAGVSDMDLRSRLNRALHAEEPAFVGVDTVFPDESLVVFAVAPKGEFKLVQRKYSVKTDGSVKLGDERSEVQPVTTFEPVTASETPMLAAACGCDKKGAENMTREQRIAALLTSGKFKEEDKRWLEQVPEEHLATLAGQATTAVAEQKVEPKTEPKIEPKTELKAEPKIELKAEPAVAAAGAQTAEQFISAAPPELQDSLRDGMRMATEKRETLIRTLKDTGRCPFSDDQLKAKSTGELEQLATLAAVPPISNVIDFSAAAGARAAASVNEVPPPPSFVAAVSGKQA